MTVEGNAYVPRDAVLRPSRTHTFCLWKGTASYVDFEVDGEVNRDAAEEITGRVAFRRGVEVR